MLSYFNVLTILVMNFIELERIIKDILQFAYYYPPKISFKTVSIESISSNSM